MRYEERPPGSRLRSLVDRFSALETLDTDPALPSPVPPDGHVEVMVHIGAPFAELGTETPGAWAIDEASLTAVFAARGSHPQR